MRQNAVHMQCTWLRHAVDMDMDMEHGVDMQWTCTCTWSMEWTCSGHAVHMRLAERPVGQVGDMADAERDACGELGAPDVAHARDGREHAHGQADEEGVATLDAAEGRRAVRLVGWQLQLGGRAACADARRRGMRRLSGRSSEARRGAARRLLLSALWHGCWRAARPV